MIEKNNKILSICYRC